MSFLINVFLNKNIIFSYILKIKFNMKIVKWIVSLFNKLFRKEKPSSVQPEPKVQELETDPIVFVNVETESTISVVQEETQPEDISEVLLVEEVIKPVESFIEDLSDDIKIEASDDLVEVSKRFAELVSEISVPEIKEAIKEAVETLDVSPETPIVKPEKKTQKTKPKSETTEEVKEVKKKPTRRGKPKKKS